MNSPAPDPSNRPPSLYKLTSPPERKGGGGMLIVLLLALALLGGGAYYYFGVLQKKPAAVSTLPAAATPGPRAPAAPAAPTPYNSVTEQKYIDQADAEFMAVQQPKLKAFNTAFTAFKEAGYVNAKGLSSPEALASRRALIAQCLTANDEYTAFVATQETVYKDALAKTPLTPTDAKRTLDNYIEKAKTPDVVKLRQTERDYLKSCDDMMAALEKWTGHWSVDAAGKLALKRKENIAEYNALAQKCNAQANLVAKLQSEYNGTTTPEGSATATAPAEGSAPVASPAISASPAPAKP